MSEMFMRKKGDSEWEDRGAALIVGLCSDDVEAFAEEYGLDNGDVVEVKTDKRTYSYAIEVRVEPVIIADRL